VSFRPYKFIVQAVLQKVDAEGVVLAEASTEPVVVFGCEALADWASEFTEQLEETNRAGLPIGGRDGA
jgi:hypothetical protein